MATHKKVTPEHGLLKHVVKGISGLFVLLDWCYFLTTVDAGNVLHTLTNGTLIATPESITMQEIHSVQEAYSTTTKSTEDVASQIVDWKSWFIPLSVLFGFLLIAWNVLRWCCSKNCTNYLEVNHWWGLLRFLRCCGALQYTRASITIDKKNGYKWTSEGLSVSPEIHNFYDIAKVKVTYEWCHGSSQDNHQSLDNSNSEGDGDCESHSQSIPLLTMNPQPQSRSHKEKAQSSKPFSELPHVLKELDVTFQGVLTIKASDGRCDAQCQISIPLGFNLDKFKKQLKKIYKDKLGQIRLLPWNEEYQERIKLHDIFVELDLEENNSAGYREGHQTSLLKRNEDLVKLKCKKNANTFAKRVILKGIAGVGKSTLLEKLAYDWSQGDHAFKEFELVFVLRLSGLEKGTSLFDAIYTQILMIDDKSIKDGLQMYMKQNPSKLPLLMDGWDETDLDFKKGNVIMSDDAMTIERILLNETLSTSCVILSTRPHKHLKSEDNYVSVKVKGFSKRNINVFVDHFFKDVEDADRLSSRLKLKLQESDMLQEICNIPMILMLLCMIMTDEKHFAETISGLYEQFTQTIFRRFFKRRNAEENESKKEELTYFLGEIALIGLLPDSNIWEDILTFKEENFKEHSKLCELGLEVGFITRQRKLQVLEERTFSFIHKSIQEFLAGKYLAHLFNIHPPTKFYEKLNSIDSWELAQSKFEILRFCCGISVRSPAILPATAVISHLINKYGKIFKTSGDYKRSVCKHDIVHRAEYTIDVGDVPFFSKHDHSTDCIPILTLLYEAQIKNDAIITNLFSDSVFSKQLSVFVFSDDPLAMKLFHYFLKVVGIAAANIKSIWFLKITSVELQDILSIVSNIDILDIYGLGSPSGACIGKTVVALPNLSTLNLSNYFVERCGIDMNDLLDNISRSPHPPLRHVDFTNIRLSDDAFSSIGAIMTSLLTCLTLENNQLSESHIQILSELLPRTPNLQRLNLSDNNVGNSTNALTQNLQHCKKIQALILTYVQLRENHVKTLVDFFCNWSVYLLVLDLHHSPVGEHITALSDYLQQCDQIEVLNLGSCELTVGGIETISAVLPRSLVELDLSGNNVSDMSCIINGLQHCEKLSCLDLGYNKLTDAGAVELGQNLYKWCNLLSLDLYYNYDIQNNGLDSVLRNIHHLPKLTYFRISATIDGSCSTLVKDCVHAVGETIREGGGRLNINANNKKQIQSILDLSKAANLSGQRE